MLEDGRGMSGPTMATIRVFGREIAVVRGVAAAVSVIATLVLIGWATGVDALTRAAPELPRMMPWTAGLSLLSAVALERCAIVPGSRWGHAAALLVAAGSALAVLFYLTGVPASMHALAVSGGAGAQLPGLPAPNTALAMLAIAGAIVWLDRPRTRYAYPAEIGAGVAATIAVTALIGQAYGATYLYGMSRYTGMSLPSGLCVIALAIGVFAARPERGLAAGLRSDRLGVTVTSRLVPVVFGVPIVLGWIVSTGHQARYFDVALGTAVQTVATILGGLFAVGSTAVVLDRLDAERQHMSAERLTAIAHAASEVRFRAFFESTGVAFIVHDASGLLPRWSELQELYRSRDAAAVASDQAMIEWMLDGVPVVDANPAALALFEVTQKESLRESWRSVLLPETLQVFSRAVRAALAGNNRFETEVPVRGRGGARRYLFVSVALPDHPALGRVVVSLVDVTERKRAQQMLLDAQRAREVAAHTATEAERRRMARELHDGPLQELTALKLVLEAESKQHASEVLELALRRSTAIIQELRAVVEDLRPPDLARGSLSEAISTQARVLTARGYVALTCDLQPTVRLPDWVARNVYRIAQEAIGNAVRHGRPRQLSVRLWQGGAETGLEIEDDGTGFDPLAHHRGSGLINMRERAVAIAGDLAVESTSRRGTRVRLLIPADVWSHSAPDATAHPRPIT